MERFREVCSDRGMRVTPQRAEVYRQVVLTTDHPDVDVILQRVRRRMPNISQDTVYRVLYWLEKQGLISRVQVSGDRLRFDGNPGDHHHFVCSRCGTIRDFACDGVARLKVPDEVEEWGKVEERHLQIRGICRKCLRAR